MCGKRLRAFSLSLVLFLLLFFSPYSSYSYADVILTESEATELMSEIQKSRQDLTELQIQLQDVRNDYEEQKKSYDRQLNEAERKVKGLGIFAGATSVSTITLTIVLMIILL